MHSESRKHYNVQFEG